ncbi:hypothetical protein [Williamsia herbipolensis]|uniref:hypothetical protein n=1 Tax=Williamsia herbipolensis TaxID=1603258 RepID=UPI0005F88C99|nr:hypothetical protein [Williamsia herbipolensis]
MTDATYDHDGETIFIFISEDNGRKRIDAGEDVADVVRGGWSCSPDRALGVDHLVAVDQRDKTVMHVARADFDFSESQPGKRKSTRVYFTLSPAPELEALVGLPSPVAQVRNPVAYAKTDWLLFGDAALDVDDDATRAVIDGWVLSVDADGTGYVTVPPGGMLVVETAAA